MASVRMGRPSVMAQRRAEIVGAFISLVASKGLEDVTLDDIAAEANIQRSSVRHFVGNRRELIGAAIVELSDRYVKSVGDGLGSATGIEELITVTFSPQWLSDMSDNDKAFDSLAEEAARDPLLSTHVRRASDALFAEVQAALRRDCPELPAAQLREAAYVLVCLIEHNKSMQRQGYSAALSKAAARAARTLVRDCLN